VYNHFIPGRIPRHGAAMCTTDETNLRRIEDPADVLRFVLAGNSHFTLRSERTRDRITFRVRKADKRTDDENERWFVSYLMGPNNERNYVYVGMVFANPNGISYRFTRTRKSPGTDTKQFKAFRYLFERIEDGASPDSLEFWHEGRCGRCSRLLTTPESVESGIGPICAGLI